MSYIQVSTTFELKEDAEKLGRLLIDRRLAACVQIFPVESVYSWKGKVEKAGEFLCIIKTRQALFNEVEAEIKKNHPYEVPEIVASEIQYISNEYRKWLEGATGEKQ